MKKYIPYLIFAISILILIVILVSSFDGCKRTEYVVHTDTIPGDSIPYKVEIAKPYPVKVYCDTGSTKIIYKTSDTNLIKKLISAYYTYKIYSDTLKNDTSALIVLKDTVYRNELLNRLLIFQNRKATLINTYTPVPPTRNRFYLGVTAGTKDFAQFDLGPSALFVTKKKFALSYSYQILHKEHWITGYFKLF